MKKVRKLCNFFFYGMKLGDRWPNKLLLIYFLLRGKVVELIGGRFFEALPVPNRIGVVFKNRRLSIHTSKDYGLPHIFYEVFITQDYRLNFAGFPRCIIDVGAHVGLTALYYECLYPGVTIYAFEPSSENFRHLRLNTNRFHNIQAFQTAVYSSTGVARLFLQNVGIGHSLLQQQGSGAMEKIRTVTLDAFVGAHKIDHVDLLKLDAEGSEEEILTTANCLDRFDHIIGEVHLKLVNLETIVNTLRRSFDITMRNTEPSLALFSAKRKLAKATNERPNAGDPNELRLSGKLRSRPAA